MDFFTSPFGGVFAIIHLILFIYALVLILTSNMDVAHKIIWALVVGLFPLVGLIIYFLLGRK
ncbi:hypothetical protein GW846_00870 [Candidatus Gracilibacteria bacterium]|nr:hypothetical protein [Candidatus Gracilibacteria bacterium]